MLKNILKTTGKISILSFFYSSNLFCMDNTLNTKQNCMDNILDTKQNYEIENDYNNENKITIEIFCLKYKNDFINNIIDKNSIEIIKEKYLKNEFLKRIIADKNCKISIKNNYNQSEIINLGIKKEEIVKFILDISKTTLNNIDPTIDFTYMFADCDRIILIENLCNLINFINKTFDTKNVINIECLFNNCSRLKLLPDMPKWDISNITNISRMFFNCFSIISLPDISNWNTKNVTNMSGMFYGCSSLISLPDISKWDTSNIKNLNNIFTNCFFLTSLPDISKWNTSNIKNLNNIFTNCFSLV